jgi:hypothetical protein
MKAPHYSIVLIRLAALIILISSSLSCTLSLVDLPWPSAGPTISPVPGIPSPTPQPRAEVTFNLALPVPLAPGQSVNLAILDEVTGLALNAAQYPMQMLDMQHFTLKLPLPIYSVVKYRYLRTGGALAQEDTTADQLVRYRLHYVNGPGTAEDVLASWNDQPFSGSTGRIEGYVTDATSGQPVPDIMVTAGGVQTLTDSLGKYTLEGVVPGTHDLVAYALDGAHSTFQQGAAVAAEQTTNAPISIQSMPLVKVSFTVTVPKNTVIGAPIRLAGNLLQAGNTFGDLNGGLNSVASRLPVLQATSDGRYLATLSLPVGADFRYKYTLGDGFWNAEHSASQAFSVRQLIIPQDDVIIQDTVETWQAGPSSPILFEVTVPANTPPGDIVSIQFNPYGWTEPIPMWPLGNNKWVYKLFSPLNMLGTFGYRFCRNDQCGSADDQATIGLYIQGRTVSTSLTPEDIQDSVNGWAWLPESEPATIVALPVTSRGTSFWAGVEFERGYDPSWQPWFYQAMLNVQGLGANWLILTPTWTVTRTDPFGFSPFPGKDPLWNDVVGMISQARVLNLNVALFPQVHLPASESKWWSTAPKSPAWWGEWFADYRSFAIYHADLAAQNGVQALVLGGDWISPALPGSDTVPGDAESRWRTVIADVRTRFKGQVYLAIPYRGSPFALPAFVDSMDGVYILWSAPLAKAGETATPDAMAVEAGRLLDTDILPAMTAAQKTGVIALAYPSANGVTSGCVPAPQGGCLDALALARPNADIPSVTLDLHGQADAYQALMIAVNQRSWLSGVVSRGYYPPVTLVDKSASIRGKPAADIVWYWFPRFLGVVK